ncbi:hypothetical protein Ngar_c00450 [Candidatus Nitrososphaera gargensis Ga9.2]|uniref:Uncharacterized protein n=1 Tax=Nitrososphaera gargensis (strain Ga9.2) TaxID=1237085 RepID=K0IBP6_NITGG|nr:hypothetical protein [Candidatus Nitrososphaera gargensis]AFU56995.1 hypothetical protein Ngar_c00450 [Candidatus Nitrososphaera gargensis Ga9.2]
MFPHHSPKTSLNPLLAKVIKVQVTILVVLGFLSMVDLFVIFQPLFSWKLQIANFALEGIIFLDADLELSFDIKKKKDSLP